MKQQTEMHTVSRMHLIFWGILITALSTLAYIPILQSGDFGEGGALLQFAPAIATIVAALIFKRSLAGLGLRPRSSYVMVWAFLVPILVLTAVYVVVWLLTGSFYDAAFVEKGMAEMNTSLGLSIDDPIVFIGALAVVATIMNTLLAAIFAIGEEIGWRGFLVPALASRMSFTRVCIVSGIIWALYHYPLFLVIFPERLGVSWLFILIITPFPAIALSTIMAWLRLRSNSVWPVVLFHATVNGLTQGFFDNITADVGLVPYLASDTGIISTLAWVAVALYIWRREMSAKNQATTSLPSDLANNTLASQGGKF